MFTIFGCGNAWISLSTSGYFNTINRLSLCSHYRVSIPPVGWINASHKNGVKVLGTFITEWDEGAKECQELFKSEESMDFYTKKLVDICVHFGFELLPLFYITDSTVGF